MTLDQSDYDQVVSSLKELVALRNEFVHHFLERFDVWSVIGCQDADAYLDVSMIKITRRCGQPEPRAVMDRLVDIESDLLAGHQAPPGPGSFAPLAVGVPTAAQLPKASISAALEDA